METFIHQFFQQLINGVSLGLSLIHILSKKGGLGKGLGAIFGENTSPAVEKAQEPASAAQALA